MSIGMNMSKSEALNITLDSNELGKAGRGVGYITLTRPEIHNAFDDKLINELTEAFVAMENNDEVEVVVLRAEGKSFSAGADLNWMRRMADYSWEENYQDSQALATLMNTIYSMSKTTVCQVQGAAFGGGVGLVACCDIVIASERASFCLSEVKLGLIPAVISPYVVKAMGERQAQRYFTTAERFKADKAAEYGLVHEVVSEDSLVEKTNEVIATLLSNGPQAVKAAKSLIRAVANQTIDQSLMDETARRIADIRASEQGKEGLNAFLEKRTADWSVGQSESSSQ
ncbi:enoyl-CoA hydratase/isomerase family protein [Kangiella koreensis]|uniref:Enoyl-CoA hydratase/isomerase n=1 Tax=Kangiella koreensis (strain DSM 16069 / JCM 12317 / KCTC 12182 / SW-125) TaxID=523791 RepID=C7RB34_KANKD|nr:enoyl-CoA hydratase/isomerase family protein [Kangiella koreensis]ACV26476.1 Enoyl-CoA hydratase/isomerase [Kangiella koreensis DSM 16069]